jgi:hypothetical protein
VGICFIFCIIIHYYYYLPCCSNCPRFGQVALLTHGSVNIQTQVCLVPRTPVFPEHQFTLFLSRTVPNQPSIAAVHVRGCYQLVPQSSSMLVIKPVVLPPHLAQDYACGRCPMLVSHIHSKPDFFSM